MANYPGYTIDRIRQDVTPEQMILLQQKAKRRKVEDMRPWAKFHGYDMQLPGLDFAGAVSVESILDKGGVPGFGKGEK